MKRIILTLSFLITGIVCSYAQHELGPALSSQIFSRINYNPAGIGNSENINIFNLSRMQWVGFTGAPTSSVLNVHYYNESLKSGFGGAFTYDQIGLGNKAINAKFAYSYNLDLSDKGLISLGLSAGIDQFSKDYSEDVYDISSGLLEGESQLNPDFDFGVEYSTPKLLLGASVNHIGNMDGPMSLSPGQTYYGYVRGNFELTKEVTLIPSLLYMNSGQTNVIDISAVAFYKKNYWGGLCFRGTSAMTTLIGMEWKFLRLGYAYELSLGGVANISSNTHELMLSFNVPTKSNAPVDPKAKKGKKKKKK